MKRGTAVPIRRERGPLDIAKSIAESHGGSLTLQERREDGLEARRRREG